MSWTQKAEETMGAEKPGVVVVGTGFGCKVHVPAARAAGLEVVALVGRDRARVAERAADAGIPNACVSLREALLLPHTDIVIISTPPSSHADLAEEAIAAGRHVLVEKPFTLTATEAQRLVDGASKAGVVGLVGHEFRFAPEKVTLQKAVASGSVGTPRMATFVRHVPLAVQAAGSLPPWWFDRQSGGGWLGAGVSHVIDSIRCWLGEFESVSATLPMVSDRDPTLAEDSVSVRFSLRTGCEGVLQDSASVWGTPLELTRITGPDGALSFDGTTISLANESGTHPVELAVPPLPVASSGEGARPLANTMLGPAIIQAEILRDLALGKPPGYDTVPPATFRDGLAGMQVLDAIRISAGHEGAIFPAS